ncbi:hypothetical protein SERLA73DRAFT_184927 [Serpula lacrymans var. lacrymans S7.3]|uniref:DOPA-like domain-containing protein n=2 Tax=Serpula lacrymans var. lacrymans TaxID=341189 RepID=F8Q3R3_SERL3|nr:uncharacterized protein SERLADRAFT_473110 [Serpula lacrymans var. lacrymans S7.9]EGN96769.1 hypothetical protein SERLA73DRAFT_184927 [Serpula lacrymans var. lacrymans S7.3]EGO22374.1 hypothetical protein SERLADRAFT_473110 [Serpula lacrymans var. lacrymans S7.9]
MTYESPLVGYENAELLPSTINPDGISLFNPPGPKSASYDEFPKPIDPSNGFDFHIYYTQGVPSETKYARELHERVRREFPELRIHELLDWPVPPHLTTTFEVNTSNPHQTGALFCWFVVHRGPCSVLIHPHTGNPLRDHTELATWIGKPWPVDVDIIKKHSPSD